MLKLAAVFSDNMVLQRNRNITLWGKTDLLDGETIAAQIAGNTARTTVRDGKFTILLAPMPAGGPYELIISGGGETRAYRNVMLGEVWLAGGQSNMELELQNAKDGKELLETLDSTVNVRFYYTQKRGYLDGHEVREEKKPEPAEMNFLEAEENTCWAEASPENSKAWSAVGFYFARKVAAELNVTVGLIGCNWGGTSASCWVDKDTLLSGADTAVYWQEYEQATAGKSEEELNRAYDEFSAYDADWYRRMNELLKTEPNLSWDEIQERLGKNQWPGPMGPKNPYRPCGLYETMVLRVCPYTLRGFLYYQGESDDTKPRLYYSLLTKLIARWRTLWGDDQLPFLLVQLPMFKYKNDLDYKHWCLIREAQMRAYQTVKNTGIAVITDCGELDNIHPTEKEPVGVRLALQALSETYAQPVKAFGPIYKRYILKNSGMELHFDHAENGFVIKGEPIGFELAGEDKEFYPATAEIRGDRIFISSEQVPAPKYARYDWFNYADVTIFNETGIPLAPFRTSMTDEK